MQESTPALSAAQPPSRRKAPKPVPWRSMTAAERRVAVAKDAIKQLHAEIYLAVRMVYLEMESPPLWCVAEDRPLHEILPTVGACHVCAVGAAFLSAVRMFNSATVADLGSGMCGHPEIVCRLFSQRQRLLIEKTFENWNTKSPRILAFRARYPESQERLVAIFQNIAANAGTFRP